MPMKRNQQKRPRILPVRNGNWPPLVTNARVFGYEVAVHALFGVALGALAGPAQRSRE